jgi:hypothetical protein
MLGVDVGTANLVVAKDVGEKVEIKRLRNAFVEIGEEQRQRLTVGNQSLNAVHLKNGSYIVGDEAISIARILNKDVRRPMASGVLNPSERDARSVIGALVKALVGEPRVDGEKCAFSIPSPPLDNLKANNIWHTGFFSNLLEEMGFSPEAVNESLAIIYAECGQDDHCGIAISHGAGQVNVCASYKLVGSLEFSIARGGDWIDEQSAAAIGETIPNILKVKENPLFDLMTAAKSERDIDNSIYFHYKAMIKYELQHLVAQWMKMKNQLDFPAPIPIVLSGGTAALKGFKEMWELELALFQKKSPLPFQVKEVRMASDPFGAVARGLLTYALASSRTA